MQNRAFHARHELNHACVANVLDEAIDDRVAKFAMRHLATAEPQACLDLVAFVKEADSLIFLRLVVMLVYRNGEFHFFHDDDFLLFAGRPLALFLLVEEASVVLDAADRRDGVGRDFYEVQTTLACNLQRFKRGENAQLFAVFIDDANFAGANPVVNADK